MESSYSSRGFFAPTRIILMIVLFLFLTSLFCSKGDKTIQPVLPPVDNGNDGNNSEQSDVFYGNPSRDTTDSSLEYYARLIPFMPVETFDEIENKLKTTIGDSEAQEGQIIFIKAEPSDISQRNPPIVSFTFVASENAITPDEISVFVDSQDISSNFKFNVYYSNIRKANFYSAFFELNYYLNPLILHELRINFHPASGGSLERKFTFSAPQDDRLSLIAGGYIPDETGKDYVRDEVVVVISAPEFLLKSDSLSKTQSWQFGYEDQTSMPWIQEITRISSRIIRFKFSTDIDFSKIASVKLHPSDGIYSNMITIAPPPGHVDRGGGAYRKTAYDPPYPDCQTCIEDQFGQRYKFTGSQVQEAQGCQNNHHIHVDSYCPPPACGPGIVECKRVTDYNFGNNYIANCTEAPQNGISSGLFCTGVGTCSNIDRYYPHNSDYEVYFDMLANPYPHYEYCLVDSIGPLVVNSDKVAPTVEAYFETVIECAPGHCGPPNCDDPSCTDCEKWTTYILNVDAADNKCILGDMYFYIYFPGYVYPVTFTPLSTQFNENHNQVHREFRVNNPNIFACAEEMKIIAKDKKGNWNCKEIEAMDKEQCPPYYDGSTLPYPCALSLTFDSRRPIGSFEKQYVNLNSKFEETMDQEVCAYRLVDDQANGFAVNHGPLIYMEVATFPPLGGIDIDVEYFDPLFVEQSTITPTNTRSIFHYGDCDDHENLQDGYSESNNHGLTAEGWHELWSSHAPYGMDGRTFGDNWNYFPGYIDDYDIPECDPIRNHLPQTPCFWNCVGPEGINCVNLFCYAGVISSMHLVPPGTNIHGKFGVYFDTKGHGGDNFRFKASGKNPIVELPNVVDCVVTQPAAIFTVWRRTYLWYGWMVARGSNPIPNCPSKPSSCEYKGDHEINNGDFNKIKGILDDCFIELVYDPANEYPNLPYVESINYGLSGNMVAYGDLTGFRIPPNPPNDTILLLGVDHLNDECEGSFGAMYPYWIPFNVEKAYYNFCAVGFIWDWLLCDGEFYVDKAKHKDEKKEMVLSSAHEIVHCLAMRGDEMHSDRSYGLMEDETVEDDPRSYLHDWHIKCLRAGLPRFDYIDY